MRAFLLFAAALLAASSLSGCTAAVEALEPPAPPRPDDESPAAEPRAELVLRSAVAAAPEEHKRPPLELALSTSWAKPLQAMEANLTGEGVANVAWYIGMRGSDLELTMVEGHPYVSEPHHAPDRTRADPGILNANGRPRALTFEALGRFTLAAVEGPARVNVTVSERADPAAPSQSFLVLDEAGSPRFVPEELEVAPGTRVLFWNHADREVEVRERERHIRLPGEGRDVAFTPVNPGIHDVVALVRDAQGRLRAVSQPFLVDFERPAERVAIGPIGGRFSPVDALSGNAEDALRLNATYPLRALELRFQARAEVALEEGVVHVEVLGPGGGVLAEALSDATQSLRLEELPAGLYTIRLSHERGAFVSYRLEGDGLYRLPVPHELQRRP